MKTIFTILICFIAVVVAIWLLTKLLRILDTLIWYLDRYNIMFVPLGFWGARELINSVAALKEYELVVYVVCIALSVIFYKFIGHKIYDFIHDIMIDNPITRKRDEKLIMEILHRRDDDNDLSN